MSSVLAWFVANYITFIVVYIFGGAAYALLKWVIQVYRLGNAVKKLSGTTRMEGRNVLTQKFIGSYEYPPTAANNKARLFGWAVFWPINLIYTLFADVAREAWDFLYRKFGAMFDAIAKKMLPK